ncbi:MAG: sugar ABC transporter ATP-binding protein [Pseudomonadota bacterium]
MTVPLLDVRGVSKSFPGVRALRDVSLTIERGEVLGLLGENGAGKSTLLKILSGAQQADSGQITFDGEVLHLASPHAAQLRGIATIYQEFNLIPELTVAENVFVGREPGGRLFISWQAMRARCSEVLARLELDLDPRARVSELSIAEQQLVEIAKALSMEQRLIIMDEPTSALTGQETGRLLGIIADLRSRGISVVFVTHRLDEAMQICDRVTILRDGAVVGSDRVGELTLDQIIRTMVGREVAELFTSSARRTPGATILRVNGLCGGDPGRSAHAVSLKDVAFEARAGEVLGLAGLMGSGRTEVARSVFGADRFDAGTIEFDGQSVRFASPADAIRSGIGLVPEDRKQQALFLELAVRQNLSIAALGRLLRLGWFVDDDAENALIERYRQSLHIRMANPEQTIAKLSGGNQQKVVLSRWLALQPRLLIVDEPTRGIDVSAKSEVHQHLDEMARSGIAVIVISSELPEVLAIADRIATMCEGRMTGVVDRADATEEVLMRMMTLNAPATKR